MKRKTKKKTTPRKASKKTSKRKSPDKRYTSIKTLGEGGFGIVELCFDQRLHRTIARKILRTQEDLPEEPQAQQLLNEAKLVCYIDHPGVVPIYDLFTDKEGQISYTMKVFEGEDLGSFLQKHSENDTLMSLPLAMKIFLKLCEVMSYAHDKGVLHLDLKPPNIMLGSYGEVLLIDWGTARLYDNAPYESYIKDSGGTLEGNEILDVLSGTVGTLPFMSIEQMTELRENLTPAADIFSAGVLLYRMLTRHFPFSGDTHQSYMYALFSETPISLKARRGDIPERLSEICMKMLEKRKEDRYQSFHDVLQDLHELSDTGNSFEQRVFQKGELLLKEGELGEYALHIIEGLVEISAIIGGKRAVLATRKSGEIIGELSIFSKKPRTATATALTRTVANCLTQELVEKELKKINPWISEMIEGLSDKFIEQHEQHITADVSLLELDTEES